MGDSQAYALGPGEGRSIDLGEFAMTVKADERETGGVVSVLEAEEPSGFGPPIHVHHDCAEAFYVLEGEYIMFLEDREVVCPAGSFIFIPRGIRHGFRVGNVPSRKLNFYFPASMVGYFDDLAAALRRDRGGARRDRGIARDGDRRSDLGAVRLSVESAAGQAASRAARCSSAAGVKMAAVAIGRGLLGRSWWL